MARHARGNSSNSERSSNSARSSFESSIFAPSDFEQSEPLRPAPRRFASQRSEPLRSDSMRSEQAHPDAKHPEVPAPGTVRSEVGRHDSIHPRAYAPANVQKYSAARSRRRSREVRDSTIGSHVSRKASESQKRREEARENAYIAAKMRRARIRRIVIGATAVILVLAVALGAGFVAFRSTVSSALTLKNSDATDALVAVKSGEPNYVLVSVEIGAVAASLDNEGPDVFLLARLDSSNHTLALVAIPSSLQVTTENHSESLSSIANSGDAALINAVSNFAKVDISHFVKIAYPEDIVGLVDALGGISVNVDQAIDDPHAGNITIEQGMQTLDGKSALTFLRATNLSYGVQGRLNNQLSFAASVIAQLFSPQGNFATRLDAMGPYLQTDYSLADLETLNSWIGELGTEGILTAVLPGYFMAKTNVATSGSDRYVSTASEVANLLDDLANNRKPASVEALEAVKSAKPSSFTVEIQNGTTVEGAAGAAAEDLKAAGFKVEKVGNAEEPVFGETLVIYKDAEGAGPSRAKAVIEALGVGRAVDGEIYYLFDTDVLLIIGADNKPTS